MADFDWKSIVKAVAPVLGSAVLGPLGPLATAAIGAALGIDAPTEENIAARMSGATPDDMLKLKQADQEFSAKMKQMDVDVFALEVKDRESARVRDTAIEASGKINWVRVFLSTFTTIGIFGLVYYTIRDDSINEYAKGIITLSLGRLWGYLDTIFNFEFGSTRSGQTKDATINKMAEKST